MTRDLIRAATQLTAEVIIYACQRVLEHLAAERPMLDDPLPDTMPGPIDDFTGWSFHPGPVVEERSTDGGATWQTVPRPSR